ncbi:MAG TPA: D-aminoacylase, partial [Candidatus Acetothermia bacterium]|nr:D-aminoacylase [Candidatus Acetothermia bacterium]
MFELVIRNGMVLDGTGKPAVHADVAIDQQTIQFVGQGDTISAAREINASGLIVAPGFIDMHSHSDISLFFESHAQSKIMQGVTTEVVGNCGITSAPVRAIRKAALLRLFETNNFTITATEKELWNWPSQIDHMNDLVRKGVSSNLIPLVGGVPLRVAAAGMKEHLEPQELDIIKKLLQEELRQGIWGMSSGLYYIPESHFNREELIELCGVIRESKAIWAVHMRDEGQRLFAAVDEVIDIAHQSRVSLQISHLKLEGKSNWGRAADLLARLDRARAEGVDVHWDQYPYTAYGSGLVDAIPPAWRAGGIDQVLGRLHDKQFSDSLRQAMLHGTETWRSPLEEVQVEKIIVTEVKNNPEYAGKTIGELATTWQEAPIDAILRLLITQEGSVKVVVPAISEDDVEVIMQHPATMISSDGKAVSPQGRYAQLHPHPRYYGAFPRVLGHYVREKGILDLPEAIRKMTSLPASRLGLKDRGMIAEGQAADIVI